ncbi:MAG: hypothetical protein J6Z06_08640, partial [Lachnospiraceae bacterium]|nr:hypothetical protein [Lachnospiraceae bacterium]
MREKLRNRFNEFFGYDWDKVYQDNLDDVAYENAVLTWNGLFIMMVADLVLLVYHAISRDAMMQTVRFAAMFPVILLIAIGAHAVYFHFEDRRWFATGLAYGFGTFILLFC